MKTLEAGKRIAVKNLLFATDFSPHSNLALPYAIAIARQYGAKVFGAHIAPAEDYLFVAPEAWPAKVNCSEEWQRGANALLEDQLRGVPHEVLFEVGDVWNVLSRFIDEHDIDLLVVGTHGRTGARKLFMGSVAEKIYRQATCPVLTVGPHVPCNSSPDIQFKRILLATNFGEESLAGLRYALSLAEEDQAQLALLHVVEQPAAGIVDAEELRRSLLRRLRELLPPAAELWCDVQYKVEFGDQCARPAERIVDLATSWAADLIVLGVRPARGAIGPVTHLGHTTAQYIVTQAACPVLTVRG
jgi:nucleotide-binding universal stress UspA family protein